MAMSRSLGDTPVTSPPPMRMVPPVIGSSPAMQFSRVDLPQPEGPTRPGNRPAPC